MVTKTGSGQTQAKPLLLFFKRGCFVIQHAEMRNGSVLMSSRIDDLKNTDRHHPDANKTRVGTSRGFARSDDGAYDAF
jgi:hypothetical protein